MAGSWLIDSRTIAKKVKNPTQTCADQVKDYCANRECPNCHHYIDNSDVSYHWPGLPAGVKFDPSDVELIEHLAAKRGVGALNPHAFIDEFIPELHEDKGICYTHPENLPGARKDGSSIHFFHKTLNAYATGQRKRRKVCSDGSSNTEQVRWHKTGKTRSIENGVLKGYKKIMVLYRSSKKGSKPDKSNWVMHQYHLGTDEDEKEGEYVVSKIFYQQQKQIDVNDDSPVTENSDILPLQTNPRTPNTNPPNPPRPGKFDACDDVADDNKFHSSEKEAADAAIPAGEVEDNLGYSPWLAGESQAVDAPDFNGIDDSLLCNEIFDSASHFLKSSVANNVSYTRIAQGTNEMTGNNNVRYGVADLENLEFDTPFSQLPDLEINSQDSVYGWLDRL